MATIKELTPRELKFRIYAMHNGYREDKDEMIYFTFDDLKGWDDGGVYIKYDYYLYPEVIKEIMQFTGLKDRYGKEIYEGDIVLVHPGTFDTLVKRVVRFGCPIWEPLGLSHPATRVIGNIYENPELWKD